MLVAFCWLSGWHGCDKKQSSTGLPLRVRPLLAPGDPLNGLCEGNYLFPRNHDVMHFNEMLSSWYQLYYLKYRLCSNDS